MLGKTPDVLTCLNSVELAIICSVRVVCRTWVFYGGCHKTMRGWSTFFQNSVTSNLAQVNNLREAGLNGNLMVVLAGPFTSDQKAIALGKV